MSPIKRKIFASDTSDEDDSFKRRSSLKVNLSCSKSLSDSGNGSLWKTEIENDERAVDSVRTRRLSRNKSTHEKNCRSDPDNKDVRDINDTDKYAVNNSDMSVRMKEGIQLKRLTINLEDISSKERNLETSCKNLKDTILSKTRQIFDGENKLSIRITKVLGNKKSRLASSTHNPNTGNETVVLDMTDRHLKDKAVKEHEQYIDWQREDHHSNIVATPTNNDGRRSLERTVDKSRLTQRRLFIEEGKQIEGQTKCRIIEDIVLKKNFPLFSVRQADESGSPILSGSNRRLSLFRGRSQLRSQNQVENFNNTYSTVHSVWNTDIGMPVVSSTFIEDKATSGKEIKDVVASRASTMNKVVSMELTKTYGGIHTSEKHMTIQNSNSDMNNCNENSRKEKSREESMKRNKNTVMSTLENVERSTNKVTANDVLIAHDSKTKFQSENCTISLSDSGDTIRSSLNVNTSLDAVIETNKAVRKPSNHRTNYANQDFKAAIDNKELTVLNNQRESTSTIRTSLQMNTSIDSMRKTWRGKNDNKNQNYSNMDMDLSTGNKERNDIDSLENISLIERLRNISMRNQISHNAKSKVSNIRNEDKRHSNNSGSSFSYVEGTPYPISRSVLFRSQLKSKTQQLNDVAPCSSKLNSTDKEESYDKAKSVASHLKVSNEMQMSTQTQRATDVDTIIFEDTPSCNPCVTKSTVMEDTPDETQSEKDEKNTVVQNTEHVSLRKGKKKLMPLNENSQLCSFSPVEERKHTPEESTSVKRKRLKKKLPKRKSIRSQRNKNNIKHNTTNKQMCSDSESDIPDNKKKEIKKTRKPKKVISKKIIIKKFVDENVLNILQANEQNKKDRSLENKDSFDDFVKCRAISTQRNQYKSQKIIITTTGLSKGDKSLVKSIVKSLGAAEMELNVSRRTTHVVSTGVRTVNLLRGIIRGCWLVTLEWVLKSLENNAWLNPETFEMKHFSKAVEENRKDRQLFGPSYIPELFSACGFIYVEHKTTVPCDTLKELIKIAGGHITENTKLAKIIIGANGLKETWVIDSITTGEPQLTKLYQWK